MALAAWGLVHTASRAAEVKFTPTIGVAVMHDDNIAIIGENEGNGDESATIAADLDLVRSTATSTLTFAYRPVYVAYRTNDELSFFGQSGRLGYTKDFSERTNMTVDVAGSRTERQGIRPFRPDQPVSFVERSTETRADVRVGGTIAAGRRSSVDLQVSGGLTEFGSADLADSVTYGASGAWRYDVTERTSLGVGARVDEYSYDASSATGAPSDTWAESLQLVGTHELGRQTSMQFGAGATRTSSSGSNETNFNAVLSLTRAVSEDSELVAGIRQSVGAGTGLGGPTLDRGLYVAYHRGAPRRGLAANVLAGLWQRDAAAVGGGTGTTTAWSSAESIGWAFNRFVALDLIHSYTDQGVGGGQPTELDTSHHTYGLLFRWAIQGR